MEIDSVNHATHTSSSGSNIGHRGTVAHTATQGMRSPSAALNLMANLPSYNQCHFSQISNSQSSLNNMTNSIQNVGNSSQSCGTKSSTFMHTPSSYIATYDTSPPENQVISMESTHELLRKLYVKSSAFPTPHHKRRSSGPNQTSNSTRDSKKIKITLRSNS